MIPRLYGAKETNFEHNGIGLLVDTIECLVTEEQNGMYELELTYKVGSFLCQLLVEDNIIKAKANEEHDPQLFRIYYVSEELDGTIQAKAEHISYDLRGNFLESITLGNVTCQEAGNKVLSNLEESHNFIFYSDINHTSTYNISRCNGLECIAGKRGSLLDTFGNGAKLIRDNFNISLVKNRGSNNNVLISYRKNMTGYKRELDLTDLVTKIYPYAIIQKQLSEESTQTIEELLVLPERFIVSKNYSKYAKGKILSLDYSDDETIDTISKLRNAASKYFEQTKNDEPNINYQVEFINLYKTSNYKNLGLEQLEKVCLDDTVIVRDYRFGLDVEARVIKTVYNSLTERYEKIELGNFKDSLKLTDKDLNEKVDSTINKLKNTIVRFDVLDDKLISEVSRLDGDIKTSTSLWKQEADSITSSVSNLDGKYTEIKQTVDSIDITGMVTFNDLETEGQTVIHGGNIMANTISVDELNSNNDNPIIRLFGNCSLDATYSDEQGQGDAIRLKWSKLNYISISDQKIDFYCNNGGVPIASIDGAGMYANGSRVSTYGHSHNEYLENFSNSYFESGSHDPYYSESYNLGYSGAKWQQCVAVNGYFSNSYSYAIDNPVATVRDSSLDSVIDDVIIESPNILSRSDSQNKLMLNINALKENTNSHLFVDTDDEGKAVVNESSLLALALQEIKNLKEEVRKLKEEVGVI